MLEREYDKLKSRDGAFELMQAVSSGTSRPLKLISIPSNGYTIPYVKNVVGNNTHIHTSHEKLLEFGQITTAYYSPITANKVPQVLFINSINATKKTFSDLQ